MGFGPLRCSSSPILAERVPVSGTAGATEGTSVPGRLGAAAGGSGRLIAAGGDAGSSSGRVPAELSVRELRTKTRTAATAAAPAATAMAATRVL
jgi:hypothetical protein